jgi:hypothetical protein
LIFNLVNHLGTNVDNVFIVIFGITKAAKSNFFNHNSKFVHNTKTTAFESTNFNTTAYTFNFFDKRPDYVTAANFNNSTSDFFGINAANFNNSTSGFFGINAANFNNSTSGFFDINAANFNNITSASFFNNSTCDSFNINAANFNNSTSASFNINAANFNNSTCDSFDKTKPTFFVNRVTRKPTATLSCSSFNSENLS